MTVSAISSSTNTYQPSTQSEFQQVFAQLAQQIQGGNLSGAQQTYSELTQLQSQGQGPSSNSPLAQLLDEIGQSLQNGNISGAQQTLQSLQQSRGYHHHHGGGGHSHVSNSSIESATTSNSTSTAALTESTGTSVNVTA